MRLLRPQKERLNLPLASVVSVPGVAAANCVLVFLRAVRHQAFVFCFFFTHFRVKEGDFYSLRVAAVFLFCLTEKVVFFFYLVVS